MNSILKLVKEHYWDVLLWGGSVLLALIFLISITLFYEKIVSMCKRENSIQTERESTDRKDFFRV